MELGTLVVFFVITVILYFTIGVAEIPVQRLKAGLVNATAFDWATCPNCTSAADTVDFQVSFVLYLISMMCFLGIFLFCLFGGIGLAAVPLGLLESFGHRPQSISAKVYAEQKIIIGKRAHKLRERGEDFLKKWGKGGGRPRTRKDRRLYNQFRANVFLIEDDYQRLDKAYNKGFGPMIATVVWGWLQLFLGVLSLVLSLLWLIHIMLYLVAYPPVNPFLNNMFIALDNVFGLFGTSIYGLFAFYLLWCCVKGNFKFGLRVPLLFAIHPMKAHETLMNSFLFNTILIMLCSVTVVQFCSDAFSLYNRFTAIDVLFNVGVTNLRYIKYVWWYYYWALVIIALLAGIYLVIRRSDTKEVEGEFKIQEDNLP